MEFTIPLVREKFVLKEASQSTEGSTSDLIALSNRIEVNFAGQSSETFVLRAQNMHICVRMLVRFIQNFQRLGAIMNRPTSPDWDRDWSMVINDYERLYNPNLWGAIYFEGKPVFEAGEHHPFLDLIEKCAHSHKGAYDEVIPVAKNAFKATGKEINIEYDANVALVLDMNPDHARCGIIHRAPTRTTTFSYRATPSEGEKAINIPQVIGGTAAFLEGIQLGFLVGMNEVKSIMGIIERFSQEEKQTKEAKQRLSRLRTEIINMEDSHEIRYRPEKPDFLKIAKEAAKLAEDTLEPPPPPPPPPILSEEEQKELEKYNALEKSNIIGDLD